MCSRTGAFDQLSIPGLTGEMVDTGDAPGLAQAVLRLLSDREQALRMGQAARQRVLDQFSCQEAEGIGRVYAQLFAKL